jgi:RecA-family ATPase
MVVSNAELDQEIDRQERLGWRANAMTASHLQKHKFEEVRMVVPGYVPEGLSILAGKPKIGKSWMALDLCLGVSTQKFVLGKVEPVDGDVLYLALEDNPRRLQKRIRKLLWGNACNWPERLTLCTEWKRLEDGGVDDISDWANSVGKPTLVVLDTLAHIRPERSRNDTTYDSDYQALLSVHKLANKRGFAALALHHTRKMEADDPFDTISGTLGLTGCADTLLVIARSIKAPACTYGAETSRRASRLSPSTARAAAGLFWVTPRLCTVQIRATRS